jgi:protocatechuate 3,4-dioxygenase beta subunit
MTTRTAIIAFFLCIPALVASPSRVKIAADNEPGQRMIITGHVFGRDGKPRGGVEMYAYHTDAKGLYRPDGSFHGEPRLRGTLITAADGSYTIDTIKPAPYPNRDIPAHIHIHLRGPGYDQEEELRFDGQGPNICQLRRDSAGVLRCTHDFQLRK